MDGVGVSSLGGVIEWEREKEHMEPKKQDPVKVKNLQGRGCL